jgi:uncharacterized protein (TIGR02588 family)
VKRNWLEWLVLVASSAAILAVVGVLVADALTTRGPADIRVEPRLGEARAAAGGWVLPITVRNGGGEAAAAVTIEARATVDGSEQSVQAIVDLLPPFGEVGATVAFGGEPEGGVTFRVVSWQEP